MLLLLPVVLCLLAAPWSSLLMRRLPALGPWLLALVPLVSFVIYVSLVPTLIDGGFPSYSLPWAASMGLTIDLRVDGLGMLLALIASGIGVAVVVYAGGYFDRDDPRRGMISGWIVAFLGCMLLLATSDNLLLAFIAWEGTSLTSFALIATGGLAPARRALLVTAGGGLILLAGLLLLTQASGGVTTFSGLMATPPTGPLAVAGAVCCIVGAATKSALWPFSFWLPGAMAAPTPVSAYLHSATMVKAGVFMIARLWPIVGALAIWTPLVAGFGAATVIFASVRAWRGRDLKELLAATTLIALGTIALLLGLGTEAALYAALATFLAHACYKGTLFLVAGAVDHACHSRDAQMLRALRKAMPVTAVIAAVAAISMAGMPFTAGFAAKELGLKSALVDAPWAAVVMVLGASAIVHVAIVVGLLPFHRGAGRDEPGPGHPHEAPFSMLIGPGLLATLGLVLALGAGFAHAWILLPAGLGLGAQPGTYSFAGWYPPGFALALSALALAVGIVTAIAASPLRTMLGRIPIDTGERLHDRLWYAILGLGSAVSRVLTAGGVRAGVSMVVLVALGLGLAAFMSLDLHGLVMPADFEHMPAIDAIVGLLVAAGLIGCVVAKDRLVAIAGLGVVGTGIALVFVRRGAPDLALTQFLVEALSVVILVAAFRTLPCYRACNGAPARAMSATLAIGAGIATTLLLLTAVAVELRDPVSILHLTQSLSDGHGRNVVNVTLVDFRAIDTLGEIAVLGAAGIGVAALIFRRRSRRQRPQLVGGATKLDRTAVMLPACETPPTETQP